MPKLSQTSVQIARAQEEGVMQKGQPGPHLERNQRWRQRPADRRRAAWVVSDGQTPEEVSPKARKRTEQRANAATPPVEEEEEEKEEQEEDEEEEEEEDDEEEEDEEEEE